MKALIRRCAQCRVLNHRDLLWRLAATAAGQPSLQAPGQGGRGVYLCRHVSCLERARRNRHLSRQFPGLSEAEWRLFCEQLCKQLN